MGTMKNSPTKIICTSSNDVEIILNEKLCAISGSLSLSVSN